MLKISPKLIGLFLQEWSHLSPGKGGRGSPNTNSSDSCKIIAVHSGAKSNVARGPVIRRRVSMYLITCQVCNVTVFLSPDMVCSQGYRVTAGQQRSGQSVLVGRSSSIPAVYAQLLTVAVPDRALP